MTIALSLSLMFAVVLMAYIADTGTTGAMRRLALWLIVSARKIDA